MNQDLFISYAWTSPEHREWVRLFASQLHLLGYNIKIDETVDYGSSLSGFMREITDANHVLLIIDENYTERVNTKPESGVGIENKWIRGVFNDKPAGWLSVIFVRNPKCKMPDWLTNHNPKGFNFNSNPDKNEFPGTTQIDDVWRWVEGLPADKINAVPLAEVCKRAARVERVDAQRDPANYTNPTLKNRVTFRYRDHQYFTVGNGEYKFQISFSGANTNCVHVYTDGGLKALGLITSSNYNPETAESFLRPGRVVTPVVGQRVVLLNQHGTLCIITIDEVQYEVNTAEEYIPGHVTFSYEVLMN
jgi:hypothetical protein